MSDATHEAVRQWLARATADWTAVGILSGHTESAPESITFHCQQYVEKLLKAVLTLRGIEAPRTHDIRRLVQLALPSVPQLASLVDAADALTEYAVAVRYPDEWRELKQSEVERTVAVAREFAAILLPVLNPPS